MRARFASVVGAVVVAALALAASRSVPPPPSGHALLLSDLHFDPLAAGPDLVEKLKASRIEAWDAILEPTLRQSFPTLALRPGEGVLDGETTRTTLAGPLCTSLDRLGEGDLPVDLRPVDVVVFGRAGAYAATQAMTHFLSHPVPEQVWTG